MSGTRVPNAANAVVAPAKVRDYLLFRDHPDNDGKADFFALFGFFRERWSELQTALMTHPGSNDVVRVVPAGDGMRYRVRCNLISPYGRDPCITTIWAVETGQPPRLITAFPGRFPG
jgi:filamentous hemagglutinin